jgi:transposase InsO family protein
MKAGMSRNTGRKHLRQADPSEQKQVSHTWRTRPDPLEKVWPQAQTMLEGAPELEAKMLFEHLSEQHPNGMEAGQLRTFQRRVRQWRLKRGGEKEVFFTQEAKPGEVLAVDWTDMRALGVTVSNRKLEHLLFHAVLPFSNWEWGVRCRSESLLSLRAGLQQSLGRLGRVPRQLLIDNSSTATHHLGQDGERRGFNAEFLSICEHYGITPRTTNVSCPHENGTCESMHGHLKRRMEQHLLLRGSRDFAGEEEYDRFVQGVLEKANALRAKAISEELAVMREHLAAELPEYDETSVTVNNNSTIRVRKLVYSVPSKLIGSRLTARIYETRIVLVDGREELAELPRQGGDRGAVIDYRHVIGWLVRKPGAFAQYRWRESMFPSFVYRATYDHLCRTLEWAKADQRYLELLQLAALEGTSAVGNALGELLAQPRSEVSAPQVKALLESYRDEALRVRDREPLTASLSEYDALLSDEELNAEEVAF